jgi:putative PIN family toxin of toxin-antitoxin system
VRRGVRPGQTGHIGQRSFDLVTSPQIIAETRRALRYPRVRKLIARDLDPDGWFLDLVSLSKVVEDTGRAAGLCSDPDDDRYIATAIEGWAQFVVTRDLDGIEGVGVVTPRAFLNLLER